ncbi:MAG: DUF2316 family protein [Chloroflexota bacterium]|nr:DUF2316 family protein [Chloroflexota bacterium]
MTLNVNELAQTRTELLANLELTGLATSAVAADLHFTSDRLDSTLHCRDDCDPVDVWQLRDYLERTVRDTGQTPVPFTVLSARSRMLARMWFRLRKAPRHAYPQV